MVRLSLLVRSLLARAPVCLLCQGTRVRRSRQNYGRLAGTLFVAVRCQDCGRRFPLPRRVAATQVTLYSRIPASAPDKQVVESALRDALRDVPGRWAVEIRPQADGWGMSIWPPDDGVIRLSLTAQHMKPGDVYARVRDALAKNGRWIEPNAADNGC